MSCWHRRDVENSPNHIPAEDASSVVPVVVEAVASSAAKTAKVSAAPWRLGGENNNKVVGGDARLERFFRSL